MRDLVIVLPLVALLSPAPSPADVLATPEPAAAAKPATATRSVTGTVVDTTGAVVPGATVTLRPSSGAERTTRSDEAGRSRSTTSAPARLASRPKSPSSRPPRRSLTVPVLTCGWCSSRCPTRTRSRCTPRALTVPRVTSATKTDTPLRDVPQADHASSRSDAHRRPAHAEHGRRRRATCRASASRRAKAIATRRSCAATARPSDFFVDGVRDDVQYFRDLYNVERVEALKGPNAMIFGRGGVGGVINRVTRQADWGQSREVAAAGRVVGQPALHRATWASGLERHRGARG